MASQETIDEVVTLIEENFWKEIRVPDQLFNSLADVYEYLTTVDPYAEVESKIQSNKLNNATPPAGYFGATLLVSPVGNRYAFYPEPEGQLAQRGIKQPVLIDRMSGRSVGAVRYQDLLRRLRASKELELSYLAPPSDEVKTISIRKRATQDPPTAYRFDLGRGPMFQVLRFSLGQTSYDLRELMKQSSNGSNCITLDLRYSQGGDVAELPGIVELFARRKGDIGSLNYRRKNLREMMRVRNAGLSGVCQLTILIGQYTASAAEFLAYSLKALGGAVIVGERSFGKCSSQRKFKVSNGDLITLTNAWFEPASERCDPRGLEPDIQMDVTFSSLAEIELKLISMALKSDE